MNADTTAALHLVRRGAGTPLIFVHGNGVDHRMMLELDDAFAVPGEWERIYLDLPGFGASAPLGRPGGLVELADWLDATVGGLIGHRRFAVVGASLGGLLARDLAARRIDRCLGVGLLAPVIDPVRKRRTLPSPVVLVEDAQLMASLNVEDADAYRSVAVVQSPDNFERFARAVLPGTRAANLRAMALLERGYDLPTLPDKRLREFAGPVLVVAGRHDAVVGFEDQRELAKSLQHASFVLLDRAGHNVHLDEPQLVRECLVAWADEVRPKR